MGRPTKAELADALAEAARMREQGEDPHHVAKALLSHNYRIHLLERVLEASRHYLRSGLAPFEHTELVKAIAEVDKTALMPDTDTEDFGLE